MLNQELELSLNMAFARAREHRHEFMTVEHLLLALLSNPSAREALEACSVDLVALRQELEAFIEQTTPVLPASEEERDTQPTLSFQRVLQRAVFHVQSSGRIVSLMARVKTSRHSLLILAASQTAKNKLVGRNVWRISRRT